MDHLSLVQLHHFCILSNPLHPRPPTNFFFCFCYIYIFSILQSNYYSTSCHSIEQLVEANVASGEKICCWLSLRSLNLYTLSALLCLHYLCIHTWNEVFELYSLLLLLHSQQPSSYGHFGFVSPLLVLSFLVPPIP